MMCDVCTFTKSNQKAVVLTFITCWHCPFFAEFINKFLEAFRNLFTRLLAVFENSFVKALRLSKYFQSIGYKLVNMSGIL
jgi:hypothetical protein